MAEFKDVSGPLSQVAQQYHFHKAPPLLERLLDAVSRFVRWLHEWWRDLFAHRGQNLDSRAISHFFQFLIIVVGIGAILFLIYFLVKRLSVQQKETAKTIRGASMVEEILNAAGWKKQAERLAQKQDYRGACRAVYLSLLQTLDENGIAPFAPTKTNYEYRYLLAKHPQVQQRFKALSDLVEVVWFGNKQADDGDYQEAARALTEVEADIRDIARSSQAAEVRPASL